MAPQRQFKRNRKDHNPYPTALQIRDAYSQLPTQFGKPTKFPSSGTASGSNSVPLPTPEEIDMKRQIDNAWRVREGRGKGSKFVDIGGFRVPAPPLPDIEGRSGEENKVLAEGFKMLMEEDDELEDSIVGSMNPAPSKGETSRYQFEREALRQAFNEEYCLPHHPDITKSRTSAQLYLPQDHIHNQDEEQEDDQPIPHRLKKSRNDIIAGQETGVGVIGSSHPTTFTLSHPAGGKEYLAKVVEGEHGCDTPKYQFLDSKRGVPILPSSLDSDLPPLAIEHPARMWNSLIHSLEPELQPIVKWRYERSEEEDGWIAHMTLVLPPTHPSLARHPLFMTIPKNTRSKEYINVVDLLGGVKRWSGSPKQFKADAQNTTLVKCIADDAISWIYAPDTTSIPVDVDEDEVVEEMAGGEGVGSDEIVIDEEMLEDGYREQEPTVSVPGIPKAMSPSSEIDQEDDTPDSPGKPPSQADTDVITDIDERPTKMKAATTTPEADWPSPRPIEIDTATTPEADWPHFSSPEPKPSSQSSDSLSNQEESPPPSITGSDSDTGSHSGEEDSDSDASEYDEDPENPIHWYDRLVTTIEMGRVEGVDQFVYEFQTHHIDDSVHWKGLRYFCHFVIHWPGKDKAVAWVHEEYAESESAAKNQLSRTLARHRYRPLMGCIWGESNPKAYDEHKASEGPMCKLISLYRFKGLPAPQFGTREYKGRTYAHIQTNGYESTDSEFAMAARSDKSPWGFWNHVAQIILQFAS